MEHAAGAFFDAPQLTVDTSRIVIGGGRDSTFDLRDGRVVFLQDGRFAVRSSGHEILVFDRRGVLEARYGRRGQGPGEFLQLAGLARLPGDTLLVADPTNARFSWIVPSLGLVKNARMNVVDQPRSGWEQDIGFLPGAGLVVTPFYWEDSSIVLFNLGAPEVRVIAQREVIDRKPLAGASSSTVWDTLVATTARSGYGIRLWDARGIHTGDLRVLGARRRVTAQMRDSYLASRATPGQADGPPLVIADSLPAIERLLAAPDGILWAVDGVAPTDSTWTATALRHDGAILGRLTMKGPAPTAFDRRRVAIKRETADGFIEIWIYDIHFPDRAE